MKKVAIHDTVLKLEYETKDDYLYQFHTGGVWGDSRYNNYIYGVKEEFVTPNREFYNADAGYSGYKTSFAISTKFEKIWAGAFIRYYDLRGATFSDSPLLARDSSLYSGVFVAYLFDKKISNRVKNWFSSE